MEDEPAIRHLMRRMLELQGCTLLEARNGDEALELAQSYEDELHLLVTDVVMPGLSGFDLADELLVSRSEMKVLFISGHADHPTVRHRLRDAHCPFLLKPYTQEKLAHAI